MNRRSFAHSLAGTLAASALAPPLAGGSAGSDTNRPPSAVPYKISVMLWTVFRGLPFPQRLEKVAQAGYRNVELVGEYGK